MNISANYQTQTFKSRINIVNSKEFGKVIHNAFDIAPHGVRYVDEPWTTKEIVKGERAWTDGVKTCTAGGIITENPEGKREVVMFHLNPDEFFNGWLGRVKKAFVKNIGDCHPVQALIFGSKEPKCNMEYCGEYFDKIANIIESFRIPVTKLKGTQAGMRYANAYYDAPKDTWTVLNTARDFASAEEKKSTGFAEVVVSKLDTLNII